MPAPCAHCRRVCVRVCVRVCAVLTMFLVLFCSAVEPPPSQSEFTIDWINEPTEGDEAFFAGSGGEEEDYSLKPETEEYL